MTSITLFIIEIFISLTLSTIVLFTLSKPLINILEDLCHTPHQAQFWLAYTRMMMFISPLLVVLLSGSLTNIQGLAHIKLALMSALAGLLLGLMIVGRRIYIPASKTCDVEAVKSTAPAQTTPTTAWTE